MCFDYVGLPSGVFPVVVSWVCITGIFYLFVPFVIVVVIVVLWFVFFELYFRFGRDRYGRSFLLIVGLLGLGLCVGLGLDLCLILDLACGMLVGLVFGSLG